MICHLKDPFFQQPIKDICQRVKEVNKQRTLSTPRILMHTDAAQAIGKIRVNCQELGVDYITIVGHKVSNKRCCYIIYLLDKPIRDYYSVDDAFQFYGPRIGALFVNDPGTKNPVYPLLFGGGQERNFRPGYNFYV